MVSDIILLVKAGNIEIRTKIVEKQVGQKRKKWILLEEDNSEWGKVTFRFFKC